MKHRLLIYAIFVASLALSATANATTMVDFKSTVNDVSSAFYGVFGIGTLTYDESTIDYSDGNGEGYIDLAIDPTLLLSFDLYGQTFVATDDADYDPFDIFFPFLTFSLDGTLSFLSYNVDESGTNSKLIDQVGIDSFAMLNDPDGYGRGSILTLVDGVYEGDLTIEGVLISPVPVPAAAWLFATGLLGLVGFGRRKKNLA